MLQISDPLSQCGLDLHLANDIKRHHLTIPSWINLIPSEIP